MWNGVDLELQCLAFKVGGVASYIMQPTMKLEPFYRTSM
jgi:hypothetical protein